MNGMIRRFGVTDALAGNPEFQSALVRITACLLGALYIAVGASTQYYRVDVPYYLTLFGIYLASNVGFLISIALRPEWPARVYLGICLDVVAISLAIFITREAISPFYLLYILVFISAGTRFGKQHLVVASLAAVFGYNVVLIALDEWRLHTFEATFFLALLVLLPLYQYSLLRKVQDARAEAERANQARGDFLAFMTHELRTPLTGVVGMTELLRGTRLNDEQRDYVQAIANSADILGALIGDILDLSKIDARRIVLERIPFDPRRLVRDVSDALAMRAHSAGLELIADVDPNVPPRLIGDPLRLRQILFNLMGNAVKFTPTGEVRVRLSVRPPEAEQSSPHLLFEVVDTGIGIPPDKLPRLFERFRQADESTTRRFGGTGLGTTIARELTLLMGGAIGVESEEGCGSRFWMRLPLIEGDAAVPSASGRRLRGLRILILEPNVTCRALACAAFGREGAACEAPAEPADVDSAQIRGQRFDLLVIADCPQGRDLNGVRGEVKAALGEAVPCLFLVYPGRRPALEGTTDACLAKPYLSEDLIAAAESLSGRAGMPTDGALQAGLSSPALGLEPIADAARMRVLVAEDNEIAAKVITRFLGKMGFEITRVADGEAALTEALSGGYGIAIVDLRMPKLDGIGFTRRYRDQAPERAIPIVALTANASEDVKRDCLSAGMSDFLSKPVKPQELRRALEAALRVLPAAGRQHPAVDRPI
ncbi:ATP-binding protein [Thiocapsa roseopersicina]|uniref:histidine kinase n=1 Tax=Thiocapsa roseopersicina TaxID=1058 RepID=A0A1H3CIP7_THIRO|nr:ATP-binding protein [Thiocapsa roseopersicina]SDX53880.1 two-component system, sensor histidine kinase RpfC [Thiocapsa roseopersicina]